MENKKEQGDLNSIYHIYFLFVQFVTTLLSIGSPAPITDSEEILYRDFTDLNLSNDLAETLNSFIPLVFAFPLIEAHWFSSHVNDKTTHT